MRGRCARGLDQLVGAVRIVVFDLRANWAGGGIEGAPRAQRFGERAALYEGYVRHGGAPARATVLKFWEVFGTLKWGLICQWFARQFVTGEVRVLERAAIGRRTSEAELDLVELIEGHDD